MPAVFAQYLSRRAEIMAGLRTKFPRAKPWLRQVNLKILIISVAITRNFAFVWFILEKDELARLFILLSITKIQWQQVSVGLVCCQRNICLLEKKVRPRLTTNPPALGTRRGLSSLTKISSLLLQQKKQSTLRPKSRDA